MNGVRIKDLAEGKYLAFDLKEILSAIGPAAESSRWRCTDVWCIAYGPADEQALADRYTQEFISGEELGRLAAETRQIIDGHFEAYRASEIEPWLIVNAVDSTFWEVFSINPEVLKHLRRRFNDVQDIAGDAA